LNRPAGGAALEEFNFCGCGWPQHMLIPKGSPEGMPCELFVMISNYDDDKVSSQLQKTDFHKIAKRTGHCNVTARICLLNTFVVMFNEICGRYL
jgi:hypothetical protein